ncbi:MAG: RteC domain-containing protein [Gillisia sp.]
MNFLITSNKLAQEILKIEGTSGSRFLAYSRIIKYCREILEIYRVNIKPVKFKSISDEVQFFKEQKQIPLSELVFYIYLRSIELETTTPGKYSRKLLCKHIKKINKFFQKNREFQKYVELEHTFMDEFYFTRGFLNKVESYDTFLYRDPDFSTSHDVLLARLKAYQKLLPFFHKQLALLDNPQGNFAFKHDLKWTSSKVALIELIYALHHSGAINNGSADIISIVTLLEEVFNLKLDNFYKKFADIKVRKGRRTKFLDELTWNFEQKLNQDEGL